MNPKLVFAFIIGLSLGLLLGYIFTDLHYRNLERAQMSGSMMGMGQPQMAPGENPHSMDGVMQRIQDLEGLIEKDPQNYDALVELGNLYYDANIFEKAAPRYEAAVQIKGNDPNVLADLGTCYRNTGQFDKAVEMYDSASKLDPNHWHSLYNACVVSLYDLKNKDRAKAYYEKLKKVVPKEINLAEVEADLGAS